MSAAEETGIPRLLPMDSNHRKQLCDEALAVIRRAQMRGVSPASLGFGDMACWATAVLTYEQMLADLETRHREECARALDDEYPTEAKIAAHRGPQ